MKGTLAEIALKNAKPGNKRRTIFDGGGLFIIVEPTGGKLWRFQYRFEGKRKLSDTTCTELYNIGTEQSEEFGSFCGDFFHIVISS